VTARLAYRPELDGLRALSVLLVMAYHVPEGHRFLRGGFIGVDLFFALSGALITRILLAELSANGRIAFGAFYLRRLKRLYPALIAMLAFVAVAGLFLYEGASIRRLLGNVAISALYLASFVQPHTPMPNLGHMWSLSIEELFYLVWPLALALVLRSGRRAVVALLFLVVLLVFGWRVHLYLDRFVSASRIYFAPDTRADALAFGCLAGVALHSGFADRHRRALLIGAPFAGLALVYLACTADRGEIWFATWGYSLTAFLSAWVVARLFVADSAWLRSAPLVWTGKLSYSLYLWHIPLITMAPAVGLPPLAGLAAGIALAIACHYTVENRLRAGPGGVPSSARG
jgi:peptidoglycan/LPS O-acetylase OafA/YrhL